MKRKKCILLRVSEYIGREHDIVLMLICNEERKHYCLVNDLSRLLGAQTSRHLTKRSFCLRCFNSFNCENSLKNHKEYCGTSECIKINMPEKDPVLKFKKYCNSEKVPFVIYADIESLIKSIQSCEPNPQSSYTKKYQKHEQISFSYYIKCFDDNVFSSKPITYTGLDAMQKFVESLEKDVTEIANIPEVGRIYKKGDKKRFMRQLNVGYVKVNSMIHLMKKVIKKIKKYGIIAILRVDSGEPRIAYVILCIVNLNLYP